MPRGVVWGFGVSAAHLRWFVDFLVEDGIGHPRYPVAFRAHGCSARTRRAALPLCRLRREYFQSFCTFCNFLATRLCGTRYGAGIAGARPRRTPSRRGAHRTYHTTQLCHHRKVTPSIRRVNPACASSSSDGSDATAESETSFVERDTRAWLDTMVIGMNLCPFARAAMPGTKIIVLGSHVTDMPSLHSVIEAELAILADAPTRSTRHHPRRPAPDRRRGLGRDDARWVHGGRGPGRGGRHAASDGGRGTRRRIGTGISSTSSRSTRTQSSAATSTKRTSRNRTGTYAPTSTSTKRVPKRVPRGVPSTAVSTPPSTEELRRMIEAHEGFTGGADRRADWAAANSPVVDEKSNEKALEG